jgi:nucleotide-binding universal stress UspA family protein
MKSFRRILVDIDATAAVHPALERAVLLARKTGAALTVTDVMTVPAHARRYLPAGVEESLVEERRRQLAAIAGGIAGVDVEAPLLVGRPATVLIEEVLRTNHAHAPSCWPGRGPPAEKPRIACAVDTAERVLRKLPCSVLTVKPDGFVSPVRLPHQ